MDRLRACLGAILLAVFTNEAAALEQYGQMFFGTPGWQGGSAFSAAFYVEQRQWPAGYGIRLYLPDRRTAEIHVGVEGNSLLIRSEGQEKLAPEGAFGPVFMQFGSFSQRLTLPLDADIGQMKLTSRGGIIEIFIPRRRQ
ncbi:MAG: Hsp20 family protein [Sedimenticolaceae bacterium]